MTPINIAREIAIILEAEDVREKMLKGLAEVRNRLGSPGASERAARIALEIIGRHGQ